MTIGYRADLPNYAGQLFTASREQTPFLSMIGGINGAKVTKSLSFPITSEYTLTSVAQPAITEAVAAAGPPAPKNFTRGQTHNTVQIFQEGIQISYVTQATMAQMSGLNFAGSKNNVGDEKDFQILLSLQKIARDVDYSFLHGAYVVYADENSAFTTRGIVTAAVSNTTAEGGATLTKALFNAALIDAWGNGAKFIKPVIFCGAFNKTKFSDIYGYAPEDRNYGGLNIKTIETDFGVMGIVLDPHLTSSTILVADLAVCNPVFANLPNKPELFYEELAKDGAAEKGQLFGMLGLDYGPEWMHLTMTGLATS
ncbi:DUF5309 family protein [candidate division WOR-3 bacterium]|nr:DUF5309 family protein [candidate division WOR-3 bacterium]